MSVSVAKVARLFGLGIAILLLVGALSGCGDPEPTPRPTATPDACAADERVYLTAVGVLSEDIADTAFSLGNLLDEVWDNPGILYNDGWRLRMAVELVALQAHADDIRSLRAPVSMSHIHGDLRAIGEHMEDAAELYARGIDDLDAQVVNRANWEIADAASLASSVGRQIGLAC